jgi:hypothetical protein
VAAGATAFAIGATAAAATFPLALGPLYLKQPVPYLIGVLHLGVQPLEYLPTFKARVEGTVNAWLPVQEGVSEAPVSNARNLNPRRRW